MRHKTVTITKRMITKHDPCDDGLACVEPLLPMKLSTDPERNLDLAMQLIDRAGVYHVRWYLGQLRRGGQGSLYDEADLYNDVPESWLSRPRDADPSNLMRWYDRGDGVLLSTNLVWAHTPFAKYRRASGSMHHFIEDLSVVAQWLANIADVIDRRRTRARKGR